MAERQVVRCQECDTLHYGEQHKLHIDFTEPVWREVIEDHHPDFGTDISDSVWITCHCGWDSSDKKAPGWFEHLLAAVEAKAPPV